MPLQLSHVPIKNILTRTSGYLAGVSSHSLQPYRGCSFGHSLCGAGCYVRHQIAVTQGRRWGDFLEVRDEAADSYRRNFGCESRWARRQRGRFSIFCSSVTDPYLPQERRFEITRSLLLAMLEDPPDELVIQTHSPRVVRDIDVLARLSVQTRLRIHVSIESDRERFPGLPAPASSVKSRMQACRQLHEAGLFVVVTVAPLLPIEDPHAFFASLNEVADAVVLDHFIGGDGSRNGSRTWKTPLPQAIGAVLPEALSLSYRDEMVTVARQHVDRVGVHQDGFASRYLQ